MKKFIKTYLTSLVLIGISVSSVSAYDRVLTVGNPLGTEFFQINYFSDEFIETEFDDGELSTYVTPAQVYFETDRDYLNLSWRTNDDTFMSIDDNGNLILTGDETYTFRSGRYSSERRNTIQFIPDTQMIMMNGEAIIQNGVVKAVAENAQRAFGGSQGSVWSSVQFNGGSASNSYSFASGRVTKASGYGAYALGAGIGNRDDGYIGVTASGERSFAFGRVAEATGPYSFAFGNGPIYDLEEDLYTPTKASASYAFAFGYQTSAEGNHSQAFGYSSQAIADYSFAFGQNTSTSGKYSVAFGAYNSASSRSLMVLGESAYGTTGDSINWVATDPLLVLGNSENSNSPSSALKVTKEGKMLVGSHDASTLVSGAQVLEILGAVQVGNTTANTPGSIRWTGSDFEGYDGTEWKSLTLSSAPVPTGPQGDISMGSFVN